MKFEIDTDKIARDELILAYQMNIEFDKDEGGIYMERDEELLDALEKVIEYYSSVTEYKEFLQTYATMRIRNAESIKT